MEVIEKTYLKSTSFQLLQNWSVRYLLESRFSYNEKYDFAPIRSFLTKSRNRFAVENGKSYQRVTVKINNGGVFPRDIEIGENIGTKSQFLIKAGQFIMSKIDARNGAFGLVPASLDGAIVTNDYPVFDVDKTKIISEFLVLITTTKEFIKFAQSCSSGTTNRQRIDIESFLSVKIPLPSIPEQNRIVEAYDKKINQAEELEQKAKKLEEGIEDNLFKTLNIQISKSKEKNKGFSLINFSKSSRWDVPFLLGNIPTFESKFELIEFSKIITNFNKDIDSKSIRINTTSFPKENFLFIGMENVEKETGRLVKFQKLKGSEIKSQTLKVPKGYILFGKLRPYLNKYWVNETEHENIVCSSEFFVFDIESNINKEYFIYALSSRFVQNQIADKTSGARMPRINETIFFNLKIPLPDLSTQLELVKNLNKMKNDSFENKSESQRIRIRAIKEFENEIFEKCN
jgi:type I restriction enzyme S subunit